jgi:hypothetical protein
MLSDATSDAQDAKYAIRGAQIYIFPTPSWSGSLQVEYTQAHTDLSAGGDSWTGGYVPGWWRWVVYDCLVVCAAQVEDDIQPWILLREQEWKRIVRAIKFDRARPRTVTLVSPTGAYHGRAPWMY